jgi:hypothetical protein
MNALRRIGAIGAAALVFVAMAVVLFWLLKPRYNATEVQRTVVTTIQKEAPASFYVTGTLDVAVTEEVERTEQLFPVLFALLREAQPSWPGIDRVNQGAARATVRVPGRISYGFDVSQLTPEKIHVRQDGLVEVTLPALRVYSAEPYLRSLEVKTEATGWMQLFGSQEKAAEREALSGMQEALRRQGEAHINTSAQPRVNTAKALEQLLRPVLIAAGIPNPRFRFEIGDQLVMLPRPQG